MWQKLTASQVIVQDFVSLFKSSYFKEQLLCAYKADPYP